MLAGILYAHRWLNNHPSHGSDTPETQRGIGSLQKKDLISGNADLFTSQILEKANVN